MDQKAPGKRTMRLATGFFLAVALLVPGTVFSQKIGANGEPEFEVTRKIRKDWPRTDFTTYDVPLYDFTPAGPRKNEVPPINTPKFRNLVAEDATNLEPVVSVTFNGDARAYPISILLWHEIVNDTVGSVPVAITFSPLTNSTRVFRREVAGQVTTLGTSGLLRSAGQVFFDEQTQSWWQQIIGTAVFGASSGQTIEALPARIESAAAFAARNPGGQVLVPNIKGRRPYGRTPFPRYDSAKVAVHYKGEYKRALPPLTRLVVVDNEAWSLDLVKVQGSIETNDLRIRYSQGMKSPLDKLVIAKSRDIGFVTVEKREGESWVDAVYDVPFAFAYDAFHPDHPIHH
jgi:uncharacterized protein DUF3179